MRVSVAIAQAAFPHIGLSSSVSLLPEYVVLAVGEVRGDTDAQSTGHFHPAVPSLEDGQFVLPAVKVSNDGPGSVGRFVSQAVSALKIVSSPVLGSEETIQQLDYHPRALRVVFLWALMHIEEAHVVSA